jgi:hypothetical protein
MVRIPLKTYPADEQARVADEIEAAPEGARWPQWIGDYGGLRRAICAAEGWRQPVCQTIRQRTR